MQHFAFFRKPLIAKQRQPHGQSAEQFLTADEAPAQEFVPAQTFQHNLRGGEKAQKQQNAVAVPSVFAAQQHHKQHQRHQRFRHEQRPGPQLVGGVVHHEGKAAKEALFIDVFAVPLPGKAFAEPEGGDHQRHGGSVGVHQAKGALSAAAPQRQQAARQSAVKHVPILPQSEKLRKGGRVILQIDQPVEKVGAEHAQKGRQDGSQRQREGVEAPLFSLPEAQPPKQCQPGQQKNRSERRGSRTDVQHHENSTFFRFRFAASIQKTTKKHRLIIPRDGACFKAKKKGYSST